jgi:hypothetical protein
MEAVKIVPMEIEANIPLAEKTFLQFCWNHCSLDIFV